MTTPTLREAATDALRIFNWLSRRSIYGDTDMAAVHANLRAALAQPVPDATCIVCHALPPCQHSHPSVAAAHPQQPVAPVYADQAQIPWLLHGDTAARIGNEHRVSAAAVQAVAHAVHKLTTAHPQQPAPLTEAQVQEAVAAGWLAAPAAPGGEG